MDATTAPTPPVRITALTSLRGIAALLVVLFHLSGQFPHLAAVYGETFVVKGYLWVDFFFVLSGFILMHVYGAAFRAACRWRDVARFLAARVARIYPLHIAVLGAFVALEGTKLMLSEAGAVTLGEPPFGAAHSLYALLVNVLMLQAVGLTDGLTWNGPSWSIGAEWFAYLAFPLLALTVQRIGWRARIALVLAAMAGLMAIAASGWKLEDATFDTGALRCLFEFTMGVVVYLVYRGGIAAGLARRDGFAAAVVLAVVVLLQADAPDLLLPPLFALVILAFARNDGLGARLAGAPVPEFLGRISYAIYLCHIFVIEVVNLAWLAVTGHRVGMALGPWESLLALAAIMGAVIVLAAALNRWIEVPARAALKARLTRAVPVQRAATERIALP